ncbi:MAG: hypothetical protein VXV96_13305 [Bdellovibrionota bacterium]|nr:hypothetical protein [Bdellovibrionota bacterium]
MKKKNFTFPLILISLQILLGCIKEPIPTNSSDGYFIQPGDIIISDNAQDSVILYDSEGNFKDVILDAVNNAEITYGVAWDPVTKSVLVSIDGSDRITSIKAIDGSISTRISNANLAGALRSVSTLSNGDIVVLESNNLEKFTNSGTRITSGFPIAGIQSNPADIHGLASGGFIVCSYGTDVVRSYDNDGNQIATRSSGIAATNAYGCTELANGNIAVTWDGGTDTVIVYDSTLSTEVATYSDTSIISAPRAIAQANNGNLLVADSNFDHIIEIDQSGNFVRYLISFGLSSVWDMMVVPSF